MAKITKVVCDNCRSEKEVGEFFMRMSDESSVHTKAEGDLCKTCNEIVINRLRFICGDFGLNLTSN